MNKTGPNDENGSERYQRFRKRVKGSEKLENLHWRRSRKNIFFGGGGGGGSRGLFQCIKQRGCDHIIIKFFLFIGDKGPRLMNLCLAPVKIINSLRAAELRKRAVWMRDYERYVLIKYYDVFLFPTV